MIYHKTAENLGMHMFHGAFRVNTMGTRTRHHEPSWKPGLQGLAENIINPLTVPSPP